MKPRRHLHAYLMLALAALVAFTAVLPPHLLQWAAAGVLLSSAVAAYRVRQVHTAAPRGEAIAAPAAGYTATDEPLACPTVSPGFLHRIVDSLNEGLIVSDAHATILFANRAACRLFGYTPEQLAGAPLATLFVDAEQRDWVSGSRLGECRFRHRSGRVLPVDVSVASSAAEAGGEHVYVVSEIAERQSMEAELALYRSSLEQLVVERTKDLTAMVQELESFSYSVSHDLHAPLRAINGFGAALKEDCRDQLDARGHHYLERMENATVRMGQLIDGLLVLSRVVRSELRRTRVDLSALAAEIAAEIAAGDPPRQVAFSIAPHMTVQADPAQMRLLLQNLLGNAWKFTSQRERARIEFGCAEGVGGPVFFLRDNGTGFDPIGAGGLFRPFHRLHSSEEYPGTGVGLATVQRIVQRHGGQVWAEADPATGATFFFTLPDQPAVQVEESRVSALAPLSNSVNSQRPSVTA